MKRWTLMGVLCLTLAGAQILASRDAEAPALATPPTPAEMLKTFRLPPDLRIELVAAEPDVQSPVAMAFDEDGRLFVVEMLDYPNGPAKGAKPAGRIRLLEERDGKYTATSVYADGLLYANGVLPWQGGVIVTSAPNIMLHQDRDGDGRADVHAALYQGFATENPQLRVSHPNLGIDNWIYVANGLRGGKISRSLGVAAGPIDISGRDFRFDLLKNRQEAVTGQGQFGNTFDDWGQRFVCSNRHHWVHLVLPEHYVKRNPHLAVPPPHRDNQGPGGSARVYPLAPQETTAAEHAGSFTAACGVYVYRGVALPEAYRGSIFTCEPTGSLVHQEILLPQGPTFVGKPAQVGKEFLASTSEWFRPVFLTSGPDGALYVVDMCRKVVEHPHWMPKEKRERPDLEWGKNHGRIWRITAKDAKPPTAARKLSKANLGELLEALAHPDGWRRTTAQRLLLLHTNNPATLGPGLRVTLESARLPQAQVQAAWLLEQRGELFADGALVLLQHELPRVRAHGLRLAERWLATDARIQKAVLEMLPKADGALRFQLALSLGAWQDERVLPVLARIAEHDADEHWTRLAIASSVGSREEKLLALLAGAQGPFAAENAPGRVRLFHELAVLLGSRQDSKAIGAALQAVVRIPTAATSPYPPAVRNGLAEGLQRRGAQLTALLTALPEEERVLLKVFDEIQLRTLALARTGSGKDMARLNAVQQLAYQDWQTVAPVLAQLVQGDAAPEIRLAAVRATASFPQPDGAKLLLQGLSKQPPTVQREVFEVLLAQPERTLALLAALEAEQVAIAALEPLRRFQLLNHRRSDVRERAGKLFAKHPSPGRQTVLDKYRPALAMKGDVMGGRAVFQKATCASCHRLHDVGTQVGPDISDVSRKTPEALLVDILDPNAAIDANYVNYVVTLKSGKTLTGLLVAETAASVVLKRAEQQTDVVLRQDIDTDGMLSTQRSLMPEGLEQHLSLQEMADLIAFLRGR